MKLGIIQNVFSKPKYTTLAITVAISVFAFAVWLPNWRLIVTVFTSPSINFVEAISVIFGLFASIGTNFTALSATYTTAIAVLFGVNVALLAYYVSKKKGSLRGGGGALGVGGLISGIFGIGCAACGTFILTSLLALVGAGGIVALLPLGGEEFGILGVLLIGYATYWTIKKIDEPEICEIN